MFLWFFYLASTCHKTPKALEKWAFAVSIEEAAKEGKF